MRTSCWRGSRFTPRRLDNTAQRKIYHIYIPSRCFFRIKIMTGVFVLLSSRNNVKKKKREKNEKRNLGAVLVSYTFSVRSTRFSGQEKNAIVNAFDNFIQKRRLAAATWRPRSRAFLTPLSGVLLPRISACHRFAVHTLIVQTRVHDDRDEHSTETLKTPEEKPYKTNVTEMIIRLIEIFHIPSFRIIKINNLNWKQVKSVIIYICICYFIYIYFEIYWYYIIRNLLFFFFFFL